PVAATFILIFEPQTSNIWQKKLFKTHSRQTHNKTNVTNVYTTPHRYYQNHTPRENFLIYTRRQHTNRSPRDGFTLEKLIRLIWRLV
ncbi:unnamed protein product, partial [Ixodes persulcatus]